MIVLISGSKAISGMNVAVTGTITPQQATIKLTTTISTSTLLKTWALNTSMVDNEAMIDCLDFTLKTTNDKDSITMSLMENKKISVAEFNKTVKQWAELGLGLAIQDLKFTFNANGYISVSLTYPFAKTDAEKHISIEKLARYYYDPNTKMLSFDIPVGALAVKSNQSKAAMTMQLPLACTFSGDKMTATVPPALVQQLLPMVPQGEALKTLLSKLDSVIPADMSFFLPTIKALITDISTAITAKNVESIAITAKLQAAK